MNEAMTAVHLSNDEETSAMSNSLNVQKIFLIQLKTIKFEILGTY